MGKKSFVTDFTSGPIASSLLRFATPLFLASLLQAVYNMVDMIIVGHVMGKVGLSGVSVGGDLITFLTFIAMGFANAGQVIISQYLGARKRESISRFVAALFSFLLFCAVTLGLLFYLLRAPLLRLMNTPAEAWQEAYNYMTVCLYGLVFIFGYNASSAVLRGLGDSRHPFVFIGIASVANVILDLLFVMGFRMGAAGAALATVISQGFSFLCCAVLVIRRRDLFGLSFSLSDFINPDPIMLVSLLKLGIPMALKSMSVQVSKLFVNSFINSYGVAVSAFAGIANKIAIISNMLSSSLNTSGSTMIGQNLGANNYERVPKIIRTVMILSLAIGTVLSAVLVLFPTQLFNIFTNDPDVISIGLSY
ncbi:MAG: MATE family efflux transporter, partial [Oscillospiraceae bacterium]|nr:MATE family efflux transporter [Oscillospiraceae bacterium]